ncbi:hypothetical protein [Sorangium sp. So ce590]|uniref:hypothetical protein n=1 Tax=unclassified Sorangium TaxID=2621164 RepID=UPI003F615D75
MHTRIALALAVLVGAPACGAPEEPSRGVEEDAGEEDAGPAPRSFVVALDRATTAESVIPQIVQAGRPELAAACADSPEALVRIFNPLDPGAFADVPCASVLHGGAVAEDTSPAPLFEEGDEPIETDQQALSPFSLGCAVFVLGSSLIATRAICPRARNPRDMKRCQNWSDAGFGGISIMCAFF